MRRMAYLICLLLLAPALGQAGEALTAFSRLTNAGLIVVDSNGRTTRADQADKPLIPASTTKLATAWLALSHWGEAHRFRTHFYWDSSAQILWIRGSGDPYLVSEELDLIARSLKQKGLKKVKAIGLDNSLFQSGLVLPGTGTTNNPYDAVPTALAANFNTIAIKKANGEVFSSEPQTPLTSYAKSLGRSIKSGELRVNTGPNPHDAESYFAELMAAFLRKQDIAVDSRIVFGKAPNQPAFYTHSNSKTLGEVVRMMLKYSTNFVANQLILMLSAETYQRPANSADVRRYMEETLSRQFSWKNFTFEDGAGLSHHNRLSPRQLTELLQAFRPWKQLLPEVEPGIYAKTGTLTGVSSLAGYLFKRGEWQIFALIMNENVPYQLRNRIARELSN